MYMNFVVYMPVLLYYSWERGVLARLLYSRQTVFITIQFCVP